jgi:hypothetical protein
VLKTFNGYFQVMKGPTFTQSGIAEYIYGNAPFAFRATDLQIYQPGEAYLMPGTYPFRGPDMFWYGKRDTDEFPPFST